MESAEKIFLLDSKTDTVQPTLMIMIVELTGVTPARLFSGEKRIPVLLFFPYTAGNTMSRMSDNHL